MLSLLACPVAVRGGAMSAELAEPLLSAPVAMEEDEHGSKWLWRYMIVSPNRVKGLF